MTENNELPLTETVEVPQELTLILNNSGLELSESEAVKQSYLPYFVQLAEIKEQAKKINFENPTELDEKIARELRLKTVKIRTGSELVKDEQKKMDMLRANLKQSTWNVIRDTCKMEEEIFNNVEKARAIAEQKRKDELKAERLELLTPFTDQASIYPLGEITEDAFQDLLNGLKLAARDKREAAEKAEAERIENERKTKLKGERILQIISIGAKQENGKLILLAKENTDYSNVISVEGIENIEQKQFDIYVEEFEITVKNNIEFDNNIRLENERLQKEAEEKAKVRSARNTELRPYIIFIRDYNAMLDMEESVYQKELADIKIGAEQHYAAERERQQKEAQEKADNEAKLAKERAEKARIESELKAKQDQEAKEKADAEQKEKDRIAAEKKAAKAPDKDRLKKMINEATLPVRSAEFKTKEASDMETLIIEKFNGFRQWALTQIETL